MKVREVIKMVEDDGWVLEKGKRTRHRQFEHPTKPGKVTISGNPGEEVSKGTLKKIRNQAGL